MSKSKYPKGFVSYTKNESVRMTSSSGGLFYELAQQIFQEQNSVVYGVGFSKDFEVQHMKAEKIEDIDVLMRSKYVQSNMNDTFRDIKSDLKQNKYVMFVGTPCQVRGLYNYLTILRINMETLVLVDFICHGAPSPKIWREYLDKKIKKYKSKVKMIDFRNKRNGWHDYSLYIRFENGKKYIKSHYIDEYMTWFLCDYNMRAACYDCPFRTVDKSGSDITLADAWLTKRESKSYDKGKSLVIANTKKGIELLKRISANVVLKETDYRVYFNISNETTAKTKREQFFNDYNSLGQTRRLKKKYYYNKKIIKNYIKHFVYTVGIFKKGNSN